MTNVQPATDASPGQWLLEPDVDWWDLVRYGPPGFDVYVRIAFPDEDDAEEVVQATLAILASYTSTADKGYAAVWDGWGGNLPAPSAPRLEIPNREMLLFKGPIEVLRDAPALAWVEEGSSVDPSLVWPDDQAWCLACEVDEEIEFTIGCSSPAAHALANAFPGRTRRVGYGDDLPPYRDQWA